MAFIIIGWSSVINIMNVRSNTESIFKVGLLSNMPLLAGMVFSIGFMALIALAPPLMQVFHCVPLGYEHWILAIILSVMPLVAGEIYKIFLRGRLAKAV